MNTISHASSSSSFGFPHFQHQHPLQSSSLAPLLHPQQHQYQPPTISYQPPSSLTQNIFSVPVGEVVRCLWTGCDVKVEKDDVETLYAHICNDHIGRKTKQNLTLVCRWNGCDKVHTKRDHVTSHVRIHLPFKPHSCETCSKTFKRPQDLKKHERVHSAAHQAKLKHPRTAYALAASPPTSSTINEALPAPAPPPPQSAASSSGSGSRTGSVYELLEGMDTHRQKRRRRESSVTSNASSEVFPSRESESPPRALPQQQQRLVPSYEQQDL
ncbi:hypothetical protein BDY24DRAFT_437931 [Mrakia frigida]|uniref:C2H2-type zinc finger protein n=1 Tax=Mrakia frigida TaxID=29902 RepID=UPI003FCBFD59